MNLESARLSCAAKMRARQLVYTAIRKGKMARKPCETCSAEFAYAHHEDYSNPLDVTWLCPKCHGKRHREIRKELGGKFIPTKYGMSELIYTGEPDL